MNTFLVKCTVFKSIVSKVSSRIYSGFSKHSHPSIYSCNITTSEIWFNCRGWTYKPHVFLKVLVIIQCKSTFFSPTLSSTILDSLQTCLECNECVKSEVGVFCNL